MCIRRFFSCTYSICPPGEDPNKAGYVRISTYITQHYYIQVAHTHRDRENTATPHSKLTCFHCMHVSITIVPGDTYYPSLTDGVFVQLLSHSLQTGQPTGIGRRGRVAGYVHLDCHASLVLFGRGCH